MLPFDKDDDYLRPIGASTPVGRSFLGRRQIITIILVVVMGGGLGTAAYFVSDLDARKLISLLDIADPDNGPKLALPLPGKGAPGPENPPQLLTAPKQGGEPAAAARPVPTGPPLAVIPPTPPPPATGPTAAPPAAEAPAQPVPVPTVTLPANPTPRSPTESPAFTALPTGTPGKALPTAPIKDLLRDSPKGPLPVVAGDGRQPWRVYARPFEHVPGKLKVAVVMTDLGLERAATDAAIDRLPPEVSLAFSPYANDVAKLIKRARDAGHEALIMLPVEAADSDPGPLGLMMSTKPEDNVARLETILGKAPGAVGVAAASSRFITQPQGAPVLAMLLQRGLLFVGDSVKGSRSPAAAGVSLVIDQDPWRDAIDARLAAAITTVKAQGAVVVTASAKPVTLDRLTVWLKSLDDQGAVLAPVSALANPPGRI